MINRKFTKKSTGGYEGIKWVKRNAEIRGMGGDIVFEQKDVVFPDFWSDRAVNITADKYFRGAKNTPEREGSLCTLIDRVVKQTCEWAEKDKYFAKKAELEAFKDELTYILVNQMAAFNSPVWFNCGWEEKPQLSACFIQDVGDDMESIMRLARNEAMLFKFGSGTGTNFSSIRSSKESVSGGGIASGPLSFMRGLDSFAGSIKSGGKVRRAAKMAILNADHPDIEQFITCKVDEEKKAHALINSGWDSGVGSEDGAYSSVQYQNANNSVMVTDAFMEAVETDAEWETKFVTTGEVCEKMKARKLLRSIAEAAWKCGDPGLIFYDTVNKWNSLKKTKQIQAVNPCGEYFSINNSACNLASINVLKFVDLAAEQMDFDVDSFVHVCKVIITAQEIFVSNASYPTKEIEKNAHKYRQLGLGYANMGALIMALGVPYDSDEGREVAASITSLLTATANKTSCVIAKRMGPFPGFKQNKESMLEVLNMHSAADNSLEWKRLVPFTESVVKKSSAIWKECISLCGKTGIRNNQVSLLAPTGTIGFFMDCDTTGIEPELSLVKYKNMVGGGQIKIVNTLVSRALKSLGYSMDDRKIAVKEVEEHGHLENSEVVEKKHLAIFDCSLRGGGKRCIESYGHVNMVAAVQPFLSAGISKTINLDNDVTVKEIEDLYMYSWRLGVKAMSVYRDGCKLAQPLSTTKGDMTKPEPVQIRKKLQEECEAHRSKFVIGGHEGYLHVGLYDDGSPGELFIRMAKEGSTIGGLMDALATSVSVGLQHGVPLDVFTEKFKHSKFEPQGFTGHPKIRVATSVLDYLARYLEYRYLESGESAAEEESEPELADTGVKRNGFTADAPPCTQCGSITERNGTCYRCSNCGTSLGCS